MVNHQHGEGPYSQKVDLVSFHAQLSGRFAVPSKHAGLPDLRLELLFQDLCLDPPPVLLRPDLCLALLLALLHPDLHPFRCLVLLLVLIRLDLRPDALFRQDIRLALLLLDLRLALLLLDPCLVLLLPNLQPVPSKHSRRPDLRLALLH